MDSIVILLGELEEYLQECNNLPFSSKVVVNIEVINEFMADFRIKLPEEIKRSQRIIDEKDKIISEAERRAASIIEDAKAQAKQMLDDHEIRHQAIKEAEAMLMSTKETADEITKSAYQYVDDILAKSQNIIQETLQNSAEQFTTYDQHMREQLEILYNNRNELKVNNK